MARFLPELARLRPLRTTCLPLAVASALFTCGGLVSSVAAEVSGRIIVEEGGNLVINTRDGSWSLEDVRISHGQDTRITASKARGTERPGGMTQLDLTGKVHIDFRGASLDAASAEVMLRGEQLISVQASQAVFSHQPEGYPYRVDGTANVIRYETATGKVRFSGDTTYTDGCNKFTSNVVIYDINDGMVTDDGDRATRGQTILCLGKSRERVPVPRTPERSTAQ